MAALATTAQLAAWIREPIDSGDATAELMLDVASGMVRDWLRQTISQVTGDVVMLEPIQGQAVVMLPEFPITAVTTVETLDTSDPAVVGGVWTVADPGTYTVSLRTGMIVGRPGLGVPSWPTVPGTWRVTYDHGFAVIPDSLVGVVLGVAGRAWFSPVGVSREALGGYSVQYAMQTEGFAPLERAALDAYAQGRVA